MPAFGSEFICSPLNVGSFGSGEHTVFRVTHTLDPQVNPRILKMLLTPNRDVSKSIAPPPSRSIRAFNYWRREADLYVSGLVSPGSPLAPPTFLGLDARSDGTLWLWLAEAHDVHPVWARDDYYAAARDLGRFNAHNPRCLVREPAEWLSRSWLKSWFMATTPRVLNSLRTVSRSELRAASFTADLDEAERLITWLWNCRQAVFAELDFLPVALCHLDTNRRNLFRTQDDTTLAVDWSFVGFEAITTDASQLFASSAVRLEVPSAELTDYELAVLTGYMDGLADVGFDYARSWDLQRAFELTSCIRWGAAHLFWLRHLFDEEGRDALERRWWGASFSDVVEEISQVADHFVSQLRRFSSR